MVTAPCPIRLAFGQCRDAQTQALFEQEALVHLPALLRYASYVTRNEDDARELVQESMFEAWRSFHRYTPGTNCKAWLFRIFRNLLSKRRRKVFRGPGIVEMDALENAEDYIAGEILEHEAVDALETQDILRALDTLTDDHREVLGLLMEGLAYQDIADALGVPIGTVMSRIYRARESLQQQLSLETGAW